MVITPDLDIFQQKGSNPCEEILPLLLLYSLLFRVKFTRISYNQPE